MDFHEYANLFPMMQPDELEDLVADIKQNGLIEPIVLYEDKILDGRNRFLACGEAGVKPHYEYYKGDEPVGYVVSKNVKRRHLDKSILASLAWDIKPLLVEEAKKRSLNNLIQNTEKYYSNTLDYKEYPERELFPSRFGRPRDIAGNMFGVSGRYVDEFGKIQEEAPEIAEEIRNGKTTIYEAKKKIKKDKRDQQIQEQIKEIEQNDFTPPTQKYDVIVVDPPWPYGTKYDPNGRRAANPYPEMSLDDIKAIELPASDDCVLWLWTTHKFMRYSFDIIDAWGFRDVAIITWVKDRMGLGTHIRSQSEFCIMALKGKPTINLTNQTTVVNGKLKEHSRKPDEFYKMVNSLCVGYKLDYFSREQREGWDQYGNDTSKF